jgi:hypothetical protein
MSQDLRLRIRDKENVRWEDFRGIRRSFSEPVFKNQPINPAELFCVMGDERSV